MESLMGQIDYQCHIRIAARYRFESKWHISKPMARASSFNDAFSSFNLRHSFRQRHICRQLNRGTETNP
jgi:hypothetical protein